MRSSRWSEFVIAASQGNLTMPQTTKPGVFGVDLAKLAEIQNARLKFPAYPRYDAVEFPNHPRIDPEIRKFTIQTTIAELALIPPAAPLPAAISRRARFWRWVDGIVAAIKNL